MTFTCSSLSICPLTFSIEAKWQLVQHLPISFHHKYMAVLNTVKQDKVLSGVTERMLETLQTETLVHSFYFNSLQLWQVGARGLFVLHDTFATPL